MLQIKNSLRGKNVKNKRQTKFIKWENWIYLFLLCNHGPKSLLKSGQLSLLLETRDKVVTVESWI